MPSLLGIHHVTAIAGDPQRNVDFYHGLLGLRLVKVTVNFDDPGSYHLYYGDDRGSPGSILTFFPWPRAPRGRIGTGQAGITAFAIPRGSVEFWRKRLKLGRVEQRFGEEVLALEDPDGLKLELIASAPSGAHAIRGFHSVTLWEHDAEPTASLLTQTLGFTSLDREGNRARYAAGNSLVDVLSLPGTPRGWVSAGTVHHVAWRSPDDEDQKAWRARIRGSTPVIDRQYFHSIYFGEPGGVLFEIATDPPGFAVDEPPDQLGTTLRLPPWLEPERDQIRRALPKFRLPSGVEFP